MTISEDIQNKPNEQEPGWHAFMRTHRRLRGLALIILIFTVLGSAGTLAFLFWWKWIPELWSWGTTPLSLKIVPAILCSFFLAVIPFFPFAFASDGYSEILGMYAKDTENRIRHQIDDAMLGQDDLEKRLQAEDNHGLVKLVRYSRLQLKAYYGIGLNQTQRSFRYSVIAMWIGFVVIVSGVVIYLVPSEILSAKPSQFAQGFALLGGLIIEVISAAFLWVYKGSMYQLTYFYDRQQLNHNALLSFGIAETMTDKDAAKLKIVERLLASPTQIIGTATSVPLKRTKSEKTPA